MLRNNRYLKISGALVVLAIALVAIKLFTSRNYGTVVVENAASEKLSGSLLVCGQSFEIPELLPGQKSLYRYQLEGDSGYDLRIVFKSGKELKTEVGYVTDGMPANDLLLVGEEDIKVVERSAGAEKGR